MRIFAGALCALASSTALAQAPVTDPAADTSDEIVVTAQKREQSLQDVSLAVTAVGASRLQDAQVNSLNDLQTIVPSVNFGNDFNQAKIFIRGVGANTSTTGSSTGVAFHVDGAYVARAEAQLTSLFDLERVEVLRGPQGTLYGRNAVGGSINLITAKPTRDLSAYARLTYGNYNQIIGEAAISGPIGEKIRFRLAGKSEYREGFGINPVSGADVDNLRRRMARGQLQFLFSDRTDLLLSAEYFTQDDSSGAVHYLRDSFPGVPRLASLGRGGYAARPRDLATESQPGTETETYAFTGTFRHEFTDELSITNIANYRRFKTSLFQDLDLSAVVDAFPVNGQPTTVQERRIDSKQWSNELQLNYNTDYFNLVLGGYYFHERQRPIDNVGFQRRNGLPGNLTILARDAALLAAKGFTLEDAYEICGYGPGTVGGVPIAPKRVCTRSNLGTSAYAAFGQINIDLGAMSDSLEGFRIKLGGRYSRERATTENPSIVIRYNAANPTPAGALPTLVFNAADSRNARTFKDFTPEAGVEWQPNRNLLLYYTYSEGFKAGSGENASNSRVIVDPEKVTNHEAGIKAELLDRRLTANLAVYTYKLRDAQLNKTIAGGPTGYTTIFQNAANTKAEGFELEMAARPADFLRLSGAVSYTDAKFTDYVTLDPLDPRNVSAGTPYNAVTNPDPTAFGAPCTGDLDPATPTCEVQLAGNRTRNTPKWAWNLHGELDLPFDKLSGKLTLAGDVSYKGRTYFSEYERAIESSRSYTMYDASLSYTTADDRFRTQLWIKNLTNVFRPASTFALATGRLIGVTWLPPRTYGVSAGYKF